MSTKTIDKNGNSYTILLIAHCIKYTKMSFGEDRNLECNYEEEILLLLDKVKSDRILEIIYHFLAGIILPG